MILKMGKEGIDEERRYMEERFKKKNGNYLE